MSPGELIQKLYRAILRHQETVRLYRQAVAMFEKNPDNMGLFSLTAILEDKAFDQYAEVQDLEYQVRYWAQYN